MDNFLRSTKKRRVLVVDDEIINRELLEAVLAMNYEVDCACSGVEAMNMLRSAEQPYSLILLDLLMPEKSGFEVLDECKADENLRDIPIIVMTTEKSAEVRSIRKGADDFIPKPYRMPEVILARCERIIELSEEKALIRSLEKDAVTGLYVKLFFDAYVGILAQGVKGAMDAVAVRLEGIDSVESKTERDEILKKTAELLKEHILISKGIACRCDDDAILAFCRHRQNYPELIEKMQSGLTGAGKPSLIIKAGICENVDRNETVAGWFGKAKAACEGIADGGAAVV